VTVASVNTTLSEFKERRPRIDSPLPEWGDLRDAQRVFGFRETHLYYLIKSGRVKSVLIRGRGKTRGKRLINFDSIREMLAELQSSEPQRVPCPSATPKSICKEAQ
jgi:hypothetical protein